jgi:hypothetical protein
VVLPDPDPEANRDVHLDFVSFELSLFRDAFRAVWQDVLRQWRDGGRVFHLPGPLVIGDGSLAPLFGRRFRQRGQGREAPPFTVMKDPEPGTTRVRRIELHSEKRQLSLWSPGIVRLVNPSGDEIVAELARVLDNGAWRSLLCCFAAAQEDARDGKAPPGSFLYTPGRFADMHGIRRVSGSGSRGRIHQDQVAVMDSRLEALGASGFTATVSVGGKPIKIEADRLVYYAHTKIAEGGDEPAENEPKRGPGRRPALLYRINDALVRLISGDGAWWFPMRVSALAAPEGVPQSTWDDALKVFVLLCAKARAESQAAKSEQGLPWTWTLDALLEQANVAGEARPIRRVRDTGRALLGLLGSAGLMRHELVGEGSDARVRYDLPDQRPRLTAVPPRALPAGKPKTRGKR